MSVVTSSVEPGGVGLRRSWHLVRWNVSRALIVTRREVLDMLRDWRILAPILFLTLVFPTIANWGAGRMVRWVEQFGAQIVAERLIPFLLMVVGFFPISFSLIIALESFVGEKERHSLEPLLATPLTNTQLYIGKTLSSTVPPLIGSLLGITVYLVGVYFNVDYHPPLILVVQVILLTMAQALVMVSGAVVISSQATSVRAANLLASFIIIPMAFLIQLEAMVMFWAQYGTLWWILFGLLVLDVVLVRIGERSFNREELLGREIDELNLLAGLRHWWALTLARRKGGPRRSLWRWYREEVFAALWRLRLPVMLVVGACVAAYWIGVRYADIYPIPPEVLLVEGWYDRFMEILAASGLRGPVGVFLITTQNVRTLGIALLLAAFTLGIAAVLIIMVPFALVGYLMVQMTAAGMAPAVLWAALIPHSLIEIPTAVLATAAAVRLGISVMSSPSDKTLGEGWMEALADATRLWLALFLPLLVVAAVVEVYITPLVVCLTAGGS